ncbi:hypothetical protein ACMD2_19540 [Ananas comosus]|uniref:Sulfite exporter TauE/SafE family protein 3-like n=1 Tax=Ananas comosus TaxID=4615 RepID=A0A199VXW5_ANACO|nr:hypothetical protein ACMD2_19540 [Ananas comosus]
MGLQNGSETCSIFYWAINILQIPIAASVFTWEAVKLWRESRARRTCGNMERVCEASIDWTAPQLLFCALCGLLGGTVGGLLGSGGGFILGPLLLEIGVIPQVRCKCHSNICDDVLLIPLSALYLISVSVMAGFWGQYFVRKLVKFLKRASIIVFILSSVIFASALTMGVVGTEKTISMIEHREYMGFLNFCEN